MYHKRAPFALLGCRFFWWVCLLLDSHCSTDCLGQLTAVRDCALLVASVCRVLPAARQIAARQGHTGALLPSHIRQAYNALNADGRVPHHAKPKPLRLWALAAKARQSCSAAAVSRAQAAASDGLVPQGLVVGRLDTARANRS